jgi:hypothetical protein
MKKSIDSNAMNTLKVVAESSAGLHIVSIARRLKLNPIELARIASVLEGKGLVLVDEERIQITDQGREALWRSKQDHSARGWRLIPSEMKVTPLSPMAPYIPQFTAVDPLILPEKFAKIAKSLRRGEKSSTLE